MSGSDYLSGDCQRLAAAIQRVTGWPVALAEGAGAHVLVHAPDGRYVDWAGMRTAAEVCAGMGADEVQTIGHIDDLGWLDCTPTIDDYRAAEQALERAGLLTTRIGEDIAYEIETLEMESSP